jgi:UDP-2,3-diacylglucosamine pyrophosphatase LpxH
VSTDNKIKRKIVEEYSVKFSLIGDRPLARKIYEENKRQFESVEKIYNQIRQVRGHIGKNNRLKTTNKSLFKPLQTQNKFKTLPKSYIEHADKWYLPKSSKKVLVLSDIHIPYHDITALDLAIQYGKSQQVDTIYLNGDVVDFYAISQHQKDARLRPTMKEELELAREFFDYLRQEFPKATIYFKPGNHEHRLERYLILKAPELLDCEEFQLKILLRLEDYKIIFIDKRTKTYFGHLLVEHGDRMKSGGVNPARSLFLKYKRHVLCGHFHRKSEHAEKVYDDKIISTFSVACLCELEPEYFEVNNHVNGFAIVEMHGDNFKVQNYLIEDGKLY